LEKSIFEKEREIFFQTYRRIPIDIDYGEGVYLYAKDGKRYVDFFGGLAVNALGYGNPKVISAIEKQIRRYIHLSNYFVQDSQVELAEKLIKVTGFKRLFFCNSGTEAVEGAIKLARKWGKDRNKTYILNLTNSFHGRTMGALSLTDRPNYRDGYDPFLPYTQSIVFNDAKDLCAKVSEQTLAIIIEFIQGEGGVNVVSEEFAEEIDKLQNQYGFLLIADEIQAGVGRTGKFFAFEHYCVKPDIVVMSKAIGGGLPLGVVLGNDKVAEIFAYGSHGSTFGGNPVACAAGCAVIEEIVHNGLMARAELIGNYLKLKAMQLKDEFPAIIKEVRGKGCMIGMEIDRDGQPIVNELLNRGFLINCTNKNVLRLLPPYIMNESLCDQLFFELHSIIKNLNKYGEK